MEPWLKGAIYGGIAAGVTVALLGMLMPRQKCPDCGTPFPRMRKPANRQQALWGGATCSKCGCEVDRRGRKILKE